MSAVKYLMVTTWDKYWDKLGTMPALFTVKVIANEVMGRDFPAEADTLFIKLSSNRRFEKSWKGIARNFRKETYNDTQAVKFDVRGLEEVACPEGLQRYNIGWHLFPEPHDSILYNTDLVTPPFFNEMESCEWESFEEYCYLLLRLIGIHELQAIPRENQSGQPDGMFVFDNLAVLYDATTLQEYWTKKEQQIGNYINRLKDPAPLVINGKKSTIQNFSKQVWIITRNTVVRNLEVLDNVVVKEVPYSRLIKLYYERLKKETSVGSFCHELTNLV